MVSSNKFQRIRIQSFAHERRLRHPTSSSATTTVNDTESSIPAPWPQVNRSHDLFRSGSGQWPGNPAPRGLVKSIMSEPEPLKS